MHAHIGFNHMNQPWDCLHLYLTLVNPLALFNESPTFSEAEKGLGWGPVHSIPDENSNWGDFAAGCVDMLWHGMVWHGCMCVGVGVLELAKSCPSPHGASKAFLHTPFLTNNRTSSSYLLSTIRSNDFYQFLILLLLFPSNNFKSKDYVGWVNVSVVLHTMVIKRTMTQQHPSMDKFLAR